MSESGISHDDIVRAGFIPFDLRGPKIPTKYDDPSVPLPPLPDVRRDPLRDGEVLVEQPFEDDEEWHEAEGRYGIVVPRLTWNKYRRLRTQLRRLEAKMMEGERYDGRPIPTDEERREALGRNSFLIPMYQPLRNRFPRS